MPAPPNPYQQLHDLAGVDFWAAELQLKQAMHQEYGDQLANSQAMHQEYGDKLANSHAMLDVIGQAKLQKQRNVLRDMEQAKRGHIGMERAAAMMNTPTLSIPQSSIDKHQCCRDTLQDRPHARFCGACGYKCVTRDLPKKEKKPMIKGSTIAWIVTELIVLALLFLSLGCDTDVPVPISRWQLAHDACTDVDTAGFNLLANAVRSDKANGFTRAQITADMDMACSNLPPGNAFPNEFRCRSCGLAIIDAVFNE